MRRMLVEEGSRLWLRFYSATLVPAKFGFENAAQVTADAVELTQMAAKNKVETASNFIY